MKRFAGEVSAEDDEMTEASIALYCSTFCLWSAMADAAARALSISADPPQQLVRPCEKGALYWSFLENF